MPKPLATAALGDDKRDRRPAAAVAPIYGKRCRSREGSEPRSDELQDLCQRT